MNAADGPEPHPLAGTSVLVVSDLAGQRRRLLFEFAACDAATQVADAVEPAIAMLDRCAFDLVVTRVSRPQDGEAVARHAVALRVPVLEILEPALRAPADRAHELVRVIARRLSPGTITETADAWRAERKTSRRQRRQPGGLADLSGVSVLAVAASPSLERVLAAVLAACGAKVEVAPTAHRTADMLLEHRPDILVLDAAIPNAVVDVVIPARRRRVPVVAVQVGDDVDPRLTSATRNFDVHFVATTDVRALTDVVLDALAA